MLAVIVEVMVKLLPKPQVAQVVIAGEHDCVDAAGVAGRANIAAGITPGGLEMMDNGCIRAVETHLHAGYPVEAGGDPAKRNSTAICRGGRRGPEGVEGADARCGQATSVFAERGRAPALLGRRGGAPGGRAHPRRTTMEWNGME